MPNEAQQIHAAWGSLDKFLDARSPVMPRNKQGERMSTNSAYNKGLEAQLNSIVSKLPRSDKFTGDNIAYLKAAVNDAEKANEPRLVAMYQGLLDAYGALGNGNSEAAQEAAARAVRNEKSLGERKEGKYILLGARPAFSLVAAPLKALREILPGGNPYKAVKTVNDSLYHLPFADNFPKFTKGVACALVGIALIVRSIPTMFRAMFQPVKAAQIMEDRFSAVMPAGAAKWVGRGLAALGFVTGWAAVAFVTAGVGNALGAVGFGSWVTANVPFAKAFIGVIQSLPFFPSPGTAGMGVMGGFYGALLAAGTTLLYKVKQIVEAGTGASSESKENMYLTPGMEKVKEEHELKERSKLGSDPLITSGLDARSDLTKTMEKKKESTLTAEPPERFRK